MATFRTILAAGAALVAVTFMIPAYAQHAPLQLVPPTDEVRMTAGNPAIKATKKSTRRPIVRTLPKSAAKKATQQTAAAQSVARSRTKARHRIAPVVATAQRRFLRRATDAPAPPTFAQRDTDSAPHGVDSVMRGGSSVSLVARLPWWRNDRMQTIRYGSREAESQVMAAADAWLASNPSESVTDDVPSESFALASADEIGVSDAGETNEIDNAMTSVTQPPQPASPTFLQSLLALLGGAAAAAASARFLFA